MVVPLRAGSSILILAAGETGKLASLATEAHPNAETNQEGFRKPNADPPERS
jgi:hypothetical protein